MGRSRERRDLRSFLPLSCYATVDVGLEQTGRLAEGDESNATVVALHERRQARMMHHSGFFKPFLQLRCNLFRVDVCFPCFLLVDPLPSTFFVDAGWVGARAGLLFGISVPRITHGPQSADGNAVEAGSKQRRRVVQAKQINVLDAQGAASSSRAAIAFSRWRLTMTVPDLGEARAI
jgi:hypothetical protein